MQRASEPLSDDAQAVLRGAAAVAARILMRTLDASSRENAQLQRLFGVRSGGVDMHSLAGSFGINTDGPSAVIGFATSLAPGSNLDRITNALRLRASAFRSDAVTTIIDNRIYVLFPQAEHEVAISDWAHDTVRVVEARAGISVRAAVAVPIVMAGAAVRRTGDGPATTTSGTATDVALAVHHVDLSYGHVQVLFDVSVEVKAGEVLARFDAGVRILATPARAPVTCSDPDDQKFIDLAWAWPARVLFSRDRAVLKLARAAQRQAAPDRRDHAQARRQGEP